MQHTNNNYSDFEKVIKSKSTSPLFVIFVIVILSLFVAAVLFGILNSSGIVKNSYAEFGGAAAGFFVTLILLKKWINNLLKIDINEQLLDENEKLKDEIAKTTTFSEGMQISLDFEHIQAIDVDLDIEHCCLKIRDKDGKLKPGLTPNLVWNTKSGWSFQLPKIVAFEETVFLELVEVNNKRKWKTPPFSPYSNCIKAKQIKEE